MQYVCGTLDQNLPISLAAYMISRILHRSLGSLYSVFLAGVFTFSLFYFFRWQQITVRCLMWALKGSCHTEADIPGGWSMSPKETKTNQLHSWRAVNPVGRTMAIFIIFFTKLLAYDRVEIKKQPPPGSSQIDLRNTASSRSEHYM